MILEEQQAGERAEAIRALLARPLRIRDHDSDLFRLLAVHRDWLTAWFDRFCGWRFTLDMTGGTARLVKRRADPDTSRPAVRPSDGRPFDQTRYVLLMCVCAELVSRPHTTISDLADTLSVVCRADEALPAFDPADHRHRNAFVDVLHWLVDQRIVIVTAGAVDQYSTKGRDAVVEADVTRLALLPATTLAPSRVAAADYDDWLTALTDEPRYGDLDADDINPEQRNLWARHTLIRQVLDDPAVDIAALHPRVAEYLATLTGRQLLADATHDAGLLLERHADVLVMVDPSREATDATFGDHASTIAQTAGALLTQLLEEDRTVRVATRADLEAYVDGLLAADTGWARAYQDARGGRRLTGEALALLASFGLVTVADGLVAGRPAAARLAVELTDARTRPNAVLPSADGDHPALPELAP